MKKNMIQRIRHTMLMIIGAAVISISLSPGAVRAQTGARVTFAITPAIFRAGQPATAELSVTSVSTSPLTLSAGNVFTFFLDSSVGTVTSFSTPISVTSASLLAGDFSVSFGGNHNQINLTYNGQSKTFAFGDCLTVKIGFVAGAQAGTGKLSLSSQFVSAINGNLPFTTASIVDFANPGLASITHDQSLTGDGTPPTPLGIAPGGVTNADIAIGAVTAPDIAAGQVVKSLNGLEDAVSILAGTNVTVTPGAGTLTVSAPNLLSSVAHDSTLSGNGSSTAPLGVAPHGIGTIQLADFSVTSAKIGTGQVGTDKLGDNSVTSAKIGPGQVGTSQLAPNAITTAQLGNGAVNTAQLADGSVTAGKIAFGQVVKSLNGLTDNVNITTDSNLVIAPAGPGLIITAPNMLTTVAHDSSLTGNGTSGSPLSVVSAAGAPTQTPVAFNTGFFLSNGERESGFGATQVYTVPQGQQLVIQQLMATVDNDNSGERMSAYALIDATNVGGGPLFPIVVTQQTTYFASGSGGTASFSFGGSQQVTIYLNAGETIQFGGNRTNTSGQVFFRFYLFGYLVPAS